MASTKTAPKTASPKSSPSPKETTNMTLSPQDAEQAARRAFLSQDPVARLDASLKANVHETPNGGRKPVQPPVDAPAAPATPQKANSQPQGTKSEAPKAPKAPAAPKTSKKGSAPASLKPCACGCLGTTKSRFVPGHDARYYGLIKRIVEGRVSRLDPKVTPEILSGVERRDFGHGVFAPDLAKVRDGNAQADADALHNGPSPQQAKANAEAKGKAKDAVKAANAVANAAAKKAANDQRRKEVAKAMRAGK
jgi:hypothetical protein